MINNKRQLKVLNIFIDKSKLLTGDKLSTEIGVSSRTIRNDIKDLNYFLKKSGAEITSEKSKGYELKIRDSGAFNLLLNSVKEKEIDINLSVEERIKYILVKLLVSEINDESGVLQTNIADELFISVSTLKNDIKVLKEFLASNNLEIKKVSNKGIKIFGNEEDLRRIFYKVLFVKEDKETNNNNEPYKLHIIKSEFRKNLDEFLMKPHKLFIHSLERMHNEYRNGERIVGFRDILKNEINKYKLQVADEEYERIIYHLIISAIRSLKGRHIKYSLEYRNKIKNNIAYDFSLGIWNEIEKNYKVSIIEDEVIYVSECILADSIMSHDKNKEDVVYNIVNKVISGICEKYNTDMKDDEVLNSSLYEHLKAAISRRKYNINVENNMLACIKNKFPISFELGVFSSRLISNEIGLNLNEEESGFIALHFEAALERMKFRKENKSKRVLIICAGGIGTSLFLKVKLEKELREKIIITDVKPYFEFKKEMEDDVDFIITTVDLKINSSKVILIKNLLDDNEIENIKKIIINENHLDIDLVSIFKEELYFRNIKGNNKDEILNKITEKAKKLDYISSNVKEEIFKREDLASTEIGNLLAIPHVLHEEVKESFISVAVLDKPIVWSEMNVQVIFFIATNNNSNFKVLLEKIYKSVIEYDLVLEIIKSKDYEKLINIMNSI